MNCMLFSRPQFRCEHTIEDYWLSQAGKELLWNFMLLYLSTNTAILLIPEWSRIINIFFFSKTLQNFEWWKRYLKRKLTWLLLKISYWSLVPIHRSVKGVFGGISEKQGVGRHLWEDGSNPDSTMEAQLKELVAMLPHIPSANTVH